MKKKSRLEEMTTWYIIFKKWLFKILTLNMKKVIEYQSSLESTQAIIV